MKTRPVPKERIKFLHHCQQGSWSIELVWAISTLHLQLFERS